MYDLRDHQHFNQPSTWDHIIRNLTFDAAAETLTWTATPGARGYTVYVFDNDTDTDPGDAIASGFVTGTSFSLGDLSPAIYEAGTYYLRVQVNPQEIPVIGIEPMIWGSSSTLSPEIEYTIEVSSYPITYGPFTNGAVTGPATASPQELVQLTVTPASGYRLVADSLMANNEPIDGTSFWMYGGPVTITAEFELEPTPPPPGGFIPPPNQTQIEDEDVPLSGVTSLAYELYKLGLFRGTSTDADGEPVFSLDQPLTRLQALILTIRLMGLEEEAMAYDGVNPFTDVTAASQVRIVAYGFDKGITTGVSATMFRPTRLVTLREFTAFLLRVLDYNEKKGDFEYVHAIAKAIEIGMYTEEMAEELGGGTFLRGDAVIAMSRALLTFINGSDEIMLIDKLVEAEIFSREMADEFIEAVAKIEELGF